MSISAPDLLQVAELSAFYGELQALDGVSLDLGAGDALAVIGANGAGKSTLLRAIAGLSGGGSRARATGAVTFAGRRLERAAPEEVVDQGIALVPEGRRLFARMSVEDNLACGAYLPRCRAGLKAKLAEVYALFPRLAERRRQIVSQMSGGEQQMVAIGRALMSSPRLLMLDELSLGLSPAMVEEIYVKLGRILREGVTVILVEQDLKRALGAANRFVVMLEGRIVLRGRTGEVDEDAIAAAYFGAAPAPAEAAS